MSGVAWRRVGAALLASLCLAGCGTQARWVNCEGQLEPINVPAPKAAAELPAEDPSPPEQTEP